MQGTAFKYNNFIHDIPVHVYAKTAGLYWADDSQNSKKSCIFRVCKSEFSCSLWQD